ncbi:MAG: class I SAM-dependent methyltransferase [Cyclobacteriaceae bacterium]
MKEIDFTRRDPYGRALYDYFSRGEADPLLLHTSYDETEEMPVDWFFRDEHDFPELETHALSLCRGKILDIGAGAGSHALYLQEQELEVYALEQSPYCVRIMQERGIRQTIQQPYQLYTGHGYDTLLLLMNGIGITGTLEGLRSFLKQAHRWLHSDGCIILDSSDISYLYEGQKKHLYPYFGEISYQYEYQGEKGEWFNWLYIDAGMLKKLAAPLGWRTEVLFEDHNDQYLAILRSDKAR